MRKILLAGGGTGGHIYPNLALLPALERLDVEAVYGGAEGDTAESRAARLAGLEFFGVPCVKLVRSFSPAALANNLSVPHALARGVRAAKEVLVRERPLLVFSKGGFAALPFALAAQKLGIPVICHESDSTPGLSNRIAAMKGAIALSAYPGSKFGEFVGMPVREELFCRDGAKERAALGIGREEKVLLVAGGSSGAQALSAAVARLLPYLTKKYTVIHLTGKGKPAAGERTDRYIPVEYSDDMGALYAACDVVLSRAGATAVAELAALGKRAVFVPLPKGISRGDQIPNAELARRHGAAVVAQDANLAARLYPVVVRAFSAPPMRRISSDANGKIASVIDATIRRGVKCKDRKPSPNGS